MKSHWSCKNSINYYTCNRNVSSSLYPSERFFFEDAVRKSSSLLDIGCASGGFSQIVREFNCDISYTGVDSSQRMIEEARRLFPENYFSLTTGNTLDFEDNSFDMVIAFGVLHMTMNWKELLAEAWRVCRKTLLFDLRLTDTEGISNPEQSYQKLAFSGEWDGESTSPYIVLNYSESLEVLRRLVPRFGTLKVYGYINPVSENTVSPYSEVCMAAFCLSKENGQGEITLWDIPFKLS